MATDAEREQWIKAMADAEKGMRWLKAENERLRLELARVEKRCERAERQTRKTA